MRNSIKDSFKTAAGFKSNSKNQFLPYERLNTKQMYAFTFNPEAQPVLDHPIGVKNWWENMTEFFDELKHCEVRMYCEVSTTGRWHLHGFIHITDKLRFTIYDIPKITSKGSSKIDIMDTSDDYITWLIYCNKQQNEIQDYLTEHLYCEVDPKSHKYKNSDGIIQITNKKSITSKDFQTHIYQKQITKLYNGTLV